MSEYNFKGIKPESIELLCLNRFNDSKEFYETYERANERFYEVQE